MSFPIDPSYTRDLSDPELWARSQARAIHHRRVAEVGRRQSSRRKGAALAVSASIAATPTALPLVAVASAASGNAPAPATAPARSSIHLPANALVSEGDTGGSVVAVQRQVGVDDDGIFGPITRAAVERFQAKMGLPATGEVDARTWSALFKSSVSFVGGGGKTVMTSYHAPPPDGSSPASSPATGTAPASSGTSPASSAPAPAPAASTPATTKQAPTPSVGGCGTGKIATPVAGTVTGSFGDARSGHAHAGEDIAAPTGTPVRAAQCGTVSEAGTESGYGNLVCIQHAGGISTCYAHLSEIGVAKGAYVHVGDVIGKVGCTGTCTGPHLHFEVRENGTATNPAPYLAGTKTIAGGTTAKATTAKTTAPATTTSAGTTPAATTTGTAPSPAATTPAAETAAAPAETTPAAAPAEPASSPTETAPAASPADTASPPAETTPAAAPAEPAAAPAETAPAAATTEAAPSPTETAPAADTASSPATTTPAAAPAEAAPSPATTTPAAAPAEAAPSPATTTPETAPATAAAA